MRKIFNSILYLWLIAVFVAGGYYLGAKKHEVKINISELKSEEAAAPKAEKPVMVVPLPVTNLSAISPPKKSASAVKLKPALAPVKPAAGPAVPAGLKTAPAVPAPTPAVPPPAPEPSSAQEPPAPKDQAPEPVTAVS
jgi:hypothetical protein